MKLLEVRDFHTTPPAAQERFPSDVISVYSSMLQLRVAQKLECRFTLK